MSARERRRAFKSRVLAPLAYNDSLTPAYLHLYNPRSATWPNLSECEHFTHLIAKLKSESEKVAKRRKRDEISKYISSMAPANQSLLEFLDHNRNCFDCGLIVNGFLANHLGTTFGMATLAVQKIEEGLRSGNPNGAPELDLPW